MAERLTMPLWDPVQAHKAITHIYNTAKPYLMAGHRMVAKLEPETRRDNHNRHFHSLIGQIAQQLGATVPDLADAEDAKRILISAFRIDTRNDSDLAGEWAKFGDIRMGRGSRRGGADGNPVARLHDQAGAGVHRVALRLRCRA